MKRKQRLIGLLTSLIMVISLISVLPALTASAGTYGDYEYEVLYDGNIEITSYDGSATDLSIPSTINGKKVVSIGESAFIFNYNLESIIIPDTVTIINNSAFYCCGNIISVTIPNSVNSIESYAFCQCDRLESVEIPDSVTSIGFSAFSGEKFKAINVDPNNKKYSSDDGVLFNKDKTEIVLYPGAKSNKTYTIPDTVISIGERAFENCTKLVKITIPEGVTSIGSSAFAWNYSLRSINIPNTVTIIDDFAFSGVGISKITIPGSVDYIGVNAFYNCQSLAEITLSEGISVIEQYAFLGTGLEYVEIPKSVDYIGERAFGFYLHYEDEDYYDYSYYYVDDFSLGVYEETEGQNYADTFGIDYVLLDDTHIHSYTSEVTKEATCTEAGAITYTCTCGDNYTESIPATGHKYVETVVAPKCKSKGYTLHKCSVCGDEYKDNETAATGHNYGEWKTTKEATCTTAGTKTRTCTVCGETETEAIAATGHKYVETVVAPKCKSKGYTLHKCSVCGDEYKDSYTNASGHKYVETVVKATYEAQGYTAHQCTVCGQSYKDTYTDKLTVPTVTGLKVAAISAQAVKLTCNKVAGATGYVFYRAINGKWQHVGVTKNNAFYEGKLKSGTSYKYAVKAYKTVNGKNYYSASYPTVWTSTNPGIVNFTVTAGSKKAALKWSKVTGATGYIAYMKTSAKGKWQRLTATKNLSLLKVGLTKGKTYYFTVKAYRQFDGKTYNGAFVTKSVKVK